MIQKSEDKEPHRYKHKHDTDRQGDELKSILDDADVMSLEREFSPSKIFCKQRTNVTEQIDQFQEFSSSQINDANINNNNKLSQPTTEDLRKPDTLSLLNLEDNINELLE